MVSFVNQALVKSPWTKESRVILGVCQACELLPAILSSAVSEVDSCTRQHMRAQTSQEAWPIRCKNTMLVFCVCHDPDLRIHLQYLDTQSIGHAINWTNTMQIR
jgi:hypothetical protein